MTTRKNDIRSIVYDPQQAGALAVDLVDSLRKDKSGGIASGIADLDQKLLPFRPGELITVLGYTSHYKSGLMNWLSKQALKSIDPESNDIVIRITWEQSVEEDTLIWLAGDADLSVTRLARGLVDDDGFVRLQGASVRRATTPMWIVGHSQLESKAKRRARPRMTMTDAGMAIQYIVNEATTMQLQPRMIVLDYLQRIRPDAEDGVDKRQQMMEAVNRAKDAAISFGCPVVLGVQTSRDVINRIDKIPSINDGQETSNIEQSSDKMLSVWYPIKTEKPGSIIDGIPVTKNLLFVRLLKQKLGEAPVTAALWVDPEKNLLVSMTKKGETKWKKT